MEVLLVVGFLFVSVYLIWKITKALVKTLAYTVLFGVCIYFAAPYVMGDAHRSLWDRWTDKSASLVDETINGAKEMTNEKLLDPLKDSVDPARQLNEALKSGKNKERGVP